MGFTDQSWINCAFTLKHVSQTNSWRTFIVKKSQDTTYSPLRFHGNTTHTDIIFLWEYATQFISDPQTHGRPALSPPGGPAAVPATEMWTIFLFLTVNAVEKIEICSHQGTMRYFSMFPDVLFTYQSVDNWKSELFGPSTKNESTSMEVICLLMKKNNVNAMKSS